MRYCRTNGAGKAYQSESLEAAIMAVDRISNVRTAKNQDRLASLVENRKEDSDTAQKIEN